MKEDDIIRGISERFGKVNPRVLVGIGDDAAVIKENISRDFIVSTDSMVEGVHFTFSLLKPYEVGHRGLAAALSDIASMGGEPMFVLVNAQFPEDEIDKIHEIYDGFKYLVEEYCIDIIGGNLSRGKNVSLAFTVIGEVSRGKAWKRSGARDGDVVFITGDVGRVKAFFLLDKLNAKGYEWWFRETRTKFATPEPRFKEVERLRSEGVEVNACIDVSDGLALDLWRMAEASQVSIIIDPSLVPISESVKYISQRINADPVDTAFSSGEEYELVFTTPKKYEKVAESLKFVKIGEVKLGEIGVFTPDGKRIEPRGWLHFK